MITISLCMIVKNEEQTLGRCLGCVRDIADEIIVVDTGSADRTKEIAAAYTDKIYDFPWINDFSAARNFSFSKASMDYILWLDADDVLLPEDIAKFQQLKAALPPGTDAIMMRYNTGFDEQGRITFSCYRERLVKRSRGFLWREPVHEYLETGGSILYADACVTHAKEKARPGGRNLRIYEAILGKGEQLSPRGMYYYARELKDNGRYGDAIPAFRRFLDCKLGWGGGQYRRLRGACPVLPGATGTRGGFLRPAGELPVRRAPAGDLLPDRLPLQRAGPIPAGAVLVRPGDEAAAVCDCPGLSTGGLLGIYPLPGVRGVLRQAGGACRGGKVQRPGRGAEARFPRGAAQQSLLSRSQKSAAGGGPVKVVFVAVTGYTYPVTSIECHYCREIRMFKNKNADGSLNLCGNRIAALRKQKRLSQRALADRLQLNGIDLNKNAIQQIESGQRFVTDIELKAFAQFFQVSGDALLNL